MKKTKRIKLILSACIVVALVAVLGLSIVSKAVYHRSFMATCSELFLYVVDRDSLYNDPEKSAANIEEKTVSNLQDIEMPKVDVPLESRHENGMQVFYFNEQAESDRVLLYLHGGGYINPPASQHWGFLSKLAERSGVPIILPIYLKCTNYTCDESYAAMLEFYLEKAEQLKGKKIYIGGDSSGGGMALGLSQMLREYDTIQPEEIMLVCPWVDLTMTNEDMQKYTDVDAMLGDLTGGRVLADMWRGERELTDPMVSPTFGTFDNLGKITIFIGTREVLYPDAVVLDEKLEAAGAEHTIHIKEGMNHVYPLFPIPEADEAIGQMVDIITGK